ncbi:MAG: TolC family protein [Gammaproteobacteria bacterium]|nr:TolC family protein [Gammaproteobacteria bacterium]
MDKYSVALVALFISFGSSGINIKEFSQQVIQFLQKENSFETSKIDVQIKQLELDSSRRNYADWKANLTLGATYTDWDNDKDTSPTKAFEKAKETHSENIKLGLSKRFLNNPSSLSINIKRSTSKANIEKYKQFNTYLDYSTYSDADTLYLNWKMPFLKQGKNAETLKTYHQNILDLNSKKLSYYESQEDYLAKQLHQFLWWGVYQETILIYEQYLTKLQRIKPHNKIDQARIQNAILKTQTKLLKGNSDLLSIRQELATELNNDTLLKQTTEIGWLQDTRIINNTENYLRHNNRDLQKITINLQSKDPNRKYYKNQNLAKLNLSVDINKDLTDSNTQTIDYARGDKDTSKLELTFEYPLFGDISNQAELKKNDYNTRKLNISYQKKLHSFNSKIKSLNISLLSNQKTLKQHLKLIRSQQRQAQAVLTNYVHKNGTIKHVIDAFKDQNQAELDYLYARKDYQGNIIDYDNLLDRMIAMPTEKL